MMEELVVQRQEEAKLENARKRAERRALEQTTLKYGKHRRELRRKRFEAAPKMLAQNCHQVESW